MREAKRNAAEEEQRRIEESLGEKRKDQGRKNKKRKD